MGDKIDQDKLLQIEARLLEQEHRPFSLLKNFFNRKKWDKQDPRRKAVKVAILWRLFFSPGTVAAAGGFIAILSLMVLVWQTRVLIEQNEKINDQTYLIEAQRRATLQFEISEILNRLDEELTESNIERNLSPELKSRIIASTVAMKPYRSYENDTLLPAYSYEKAQLFIALVQSQIDSTDLSEIFRSSDFTRMRLKDVKLGEQSPVVIRIEDLDLSDSYISNVDFYNFDIDFLTMDRSSLESIRLMGSFTDIVVEESELNDVTFELATFGTDKTSVVQLNNTSMFDVTFTTFNHQSYQIIFHSLGNKNTLSSIYSTVDLDFILGSGLLTLDQMFLDWKTYLSIDSSDNESSFFMSSVIAYNHEQFFEDLELVISKPTLNESINNLLSPYVSLQVQNMHGVGHFEGYIILNSQD